MTVQTTHRSTAHRSTALGRISSLVHAEMLMTLRNKVALFYAVAISPLMVLVLAQLPAIKRVTDSMPRGGLATTMTSMLVMAGLSLAIYYNLTTAVVARREALVLKRLKSGAASPVEILVSLATPNMAIFVTQVVLVLALCSWLFGAPGFTNPVLVVVGLALGAAFFSAISFLTGVHTRTVESAQLTTMPGIFVFMMFSGLIVPISVLPQPVQRVFEMLPIAPVSELVTLGLNGTDLAGGSHGFAGTWSQALQPTLVMLGWTALAIWQLKRTMKWEPVR